MEEEKEGKKEKEIVKIREMFFRKFRENEKQKEGDKGDTRGDRRMKCIEKEKKKHKKT